MSASLTLTTAGRAALINATHTGTAAVTIAAIGLSATAITPTAAMTALAGELKRVTTIGGTVVDAATIHVTMEDDSTDAYSLLSFALYLSDGTLFALYGQADPIYTKTAASMGLLAADIAFPDASVTAITFAGSGFTNPPASTTVVGVTRFATADEAKAGIDNTIAITPQALELALVPLLLEQDGVGSGIDADLWQGKEPSAFIPASQAASFMPIASVGSGIGQFISLGVPAGYVGSYSLPAGGTWVYYYVNNGTGNAAIAAGGAQIWAGTATNFSGWAWRVA